MREVEHNIKTVNQEIQEAVRLPPKCIELPSRDAYKTVLELEASANEEWTPALSPTRMLDKLNRALEVVDKQRKSVSKKVEESPEGSIRNDWNHFEKVEAERRAFVEASYRRFRTSPPEVSVMEVSRHVDRFDYDTLDFTLPSGDVISQPVAFPREPSRHVAGLKIDRSSNTCDEVKASPEISTCPMEERRNFISKLVSSKSKDPPPLIRSGDRVEVCYCGMHFPGTVLRRNVGMETVTIQFDDSSVKDFPISCIILKNR